MPYTGPATLHIGTSGWSYPHWRRLFYPDRLAAPKRLEYYTRHFDTTEVNNSYYRWPADEMFAAWEKQLPDGFLMSVKASRGLSHFSRLTNPEEWLTRIAGGLAQLRDHLGALLVQLPPGFACNFDRLAYFLSHVPRWIKTTIEFRHPSWSQEETFALLEKYGAAYCIMSGAGLPCVLRTTAPFVYVRLHGPDPNGLYGGSYSDEELQAWGKHIKGWIAEGKEVFVYFNNDGNAYAVKNAQTLLRLSAAG